MKVLKHLLIPRIRFLLPSTVWMSFPASSSLKTRFQVSFKSKEFLLESQTAQKGTFEEEEKRYSQQSQIGVYDGELEKPAEVLTWLDDLLTGADIEQVDKTIMVDF